MIGLMNIHQDYLATNTTSIKVNGMNNQGQQLYEGQN